MSDFSDINKNNTFGIPENYFNSLTDKIQCRISEENLKENYGNENPFTIPENYFKEFSVKRKEFRSETIFQILKPYLSIAAGIILILVLWQITLNVLDNKETITEIKDSSVYITPYADVFDFSNIDSNEIELEIDNYIDYTDENSLISYTNTEASEDINISEQDAAYEYFIDYSDDYSDYEEILAEI